MRQNLPIRLSIVLAFCTGGMIQAQTHSVSSGKPPAGLPANSPTSSASPATMQTATTPTELTPAQRPAQRAEVQYTDGQLAVTANNSSLNQILREIGRTTGVKITGGVAEERVYGTYGPASIAKVLAELLDGTESNMLLLTNDNKLPETLVLTTRHGGPTPPNPNASGLDDDNSGRSPEATQQSQPYQTPSPSGNGGATVAPPPGTPPATAPTNSGAAASPSDPNGVKTPEQIYEQLQQLQRQQQQQQQPK